MILGELVRSAKIVQLVVPLLVDVLLVMMPAAVRRFVRAQRLLQPYGEGGQKVIDFILR